ncbi:MAG: class I SAM-dependent methyltransferase [Dehalococcoidia bacterium]
MTERSGPDLSLFEGTAWYYARYRPAYPRWLFELIVERFGLDGSGRLLDLGCGTGEIAVPLSRHVEEVVALDISAEMVEEARAHAEREGVTNVRWLVLPAEATGPEMGTFRLITAGSAFHWMDRAEVLRRGQALLAPGGGIALAGFVGTTFWRSEVPWERAIVRVIQRWLGPERRAGQGTFPWDHRPHEEVLAASSFERVEIGERHVRHVWTIDTLAGYLYSTSFSSPALLGDNKAALEADLRETLRQLSPEGRFEQDLRLQYILAWKS